MRHRWSRMPFKRTDCSTITHCITNKVNINYEFIVHSPEHLWKTSHAAGKHINKTFWCGSSHITENPLTFAKVQYDINLMYKQGKLLKVADTLSRAQLAETAEEISE